MAKKEVKTKPPYPTLGEACQLLASAFGTKSADPAVRKKLDRLARDGDFDWSLRPHVIEALLVKPLKDLDPDLSDFVDGFVDFVLNEHVNLLSHISLDAMSREEAAPLLIKAFGAGQVAAFLISLRDRFGGPDIGDFLRQDADPIDVVFQWAETSLGLHVATVVFPDDKQKRDDLSRWRRGKTIPDFFGSIRPLKRELEARCPDQKSEVLLLGKWLVAARALAWLDRETVTAGFGDRVSPSGNFAELSYA